MLIEDLLKGVNFSTNVKNLNIDIKNLAIHTKDVKKGALYFCLKGENFDGHSFAHQVLESGANCLVVDHFLKENIPQIKVDDCRKSLALISGNFYENPASKLHLIGITGTNGKTSSTYILKSILESCGKKVGVIGTLGVVVGNKTYPSSMTTPDPIELHEIFSLMVKEHVEYVVMEVSAHALDLQKLCGIKFDVGVLTNITQDHLDYFKTFSRYALTKLNFISPNYCKSGVVNLDDKLALTLFNKYKNTTFNCIGFGIKNKDCVFAENYKVLGDKIKFDCNVFGNNQEYETKLVGGFNVQNLLGCLCVSKILGLNPTKVFDGIRNVLPIPGRFNIQKLGNGAFVVIDYAHTPDGLENVLKTARQMCTGRLICIFGCGGDRDKTKRPIMGQISGKLADFTVVTSDNPRFEDPAEIISEIKVGLQKETKRFKCIEDREEAIEYCVARSKPDDYIVIAGKGAENYLDVEGEKIPYSDYEVIENIKKKG